jgi:RNA polymerase-binding transcription factor DksA
MTDFEPQKQALVQLRRRLIRTVGALEDAIREDVNAPGSISNVPTHPADHDAEGLDKNIALAETEEGLLEQVEAALARIENQTYGRCQSCGIGIPAARLEALPYTAFCVDCAAASESAGLQ